MAVANEPTPQEQSVENSPSSQDWIQHIPQELQKEPHWQQVADKPLSEVLKQYSNAQTRLGKSISLPDKPIEDEEWGKVYNKLGWPESPDKYELEFGDQQVDEKFLGSFKEVAHKAKLTTEQAKVLGEWWGGQSNAAKSELEEGRSEKIAVTTAKLQREWGKGYDMNMAFAKRAAQHYFGDDLGTQILDAAADNEPVLKGFAKLADTLKEHRIISDKAPEFNGILNAEDAKSKINKIMDDKAHPYWGPGSDSATKRAHVEVEQLFQLAYPER